MLVWKMLLCIMALIWDEGIFPTMKKERLLDGAVTRSDRLHHPVLPRFWRLIGVIAISLFLDGFSLHAATLPAGFTETQVGSNLSGAPTAMDFAPDGRLFVCLQGATFASSRTGFCSQLHLLR